jgi:hypothetical protein
VFGMQPYSNPTRINTEEDLNIFKKEEIYFFFKLEMTSKKIMQLKTIKSKSIIFLEMEDDRYLFFK